MSRTSYSLVALAVASTLVAPGAAVAAADWSPLREVGDHALAVALDAQTVALISIGGPDEATIYEQRTVGGVDGPRSEVVTVDDVESCRPVEAATSLGNLAVAVECHVKTGLEEPPTRLVELVWTGDDGWVWRVQREGVLASIDHSPQGQYVVFASNSQYGRAHHVTSYHADLGWRDLSRPELALTGDDLVAAIDDDGNVVTLRGSGFEDEPGYWFGGRLRIETYGDRSGRWTVRHRQAYSHGGIAPGRIDVAAGRLVAAAVESRSTGQLGGREDRVLLLSGTRRAPRLWSGQRWSRQVHDATAGILQAGVGTAAWLSEGKRREARPWLATWAASRRLPALQRLGATTSLTGATAPSNTLDLSVAADGHGLVGHVQHLRGADRSTVEATSFVVSAAGDLQEQARVAWEQPVEATVDVMAGTDAASITIGRLSSFAVPSPLVQYATRPWAASAAPGPAARWVADRRTPD
jgi:hypothetical protein